MQTQAGKEEQPATTPRLDPSTLPKVYEAGSMASSASNSASNLRLNVKTYPVRWELMILILAVVGGSVDAIIALAFDALPGPQTGNTVLLGIALAHGQFALAEARSASFLGYLVGTATGQIVIVKHRGSWLWSSAAGTIEIIELIFLATLLLVWHEAGANPTHGIVDLLVAISAIAMGIQSAVILDLPAEKPTTTYITGMLTTFVTHLVQWLNLMGSVRDVPAKSGEAAARSLTGPWIHGLTWLLYFTGVISGSFLFSPMHETALTLPIVLLVAVILIGKYDHPSFALRGENG